MQHRHLYQPLPPDNSYLDFSRAGESRVRVSYGDGDAGSSFNNLLKNYYPFSYNSLCNLEHAIVLCESGPTLTASKNAGSAPPRTLTPLPTTPYEVKVVPNYTCSSLVGEIPTTPLAVTITVTVDKQVTNPFRETGQLHAA